MGRITISFITPTPLASFGGCTKRFKVMTTMDTKKDPYHTCKTCEFQGDDGQLEECCPVHNSDIATGCYCISIVNFMHAMGNKK